MIDGLKPYPEYRESGVAWLGEVPAHWEVRPLARLGQLLKGRGGSKEDEVSAGVGCIRYGDLYTAHEFFIRRTKGFIANDRADAYTRLMPGDLLFAASGETLEEIGKSAVNLLDDEVYCGGDLIILRSRGSVDARYIGYAAECQPARIEKSKMGRGTTVKHIYPDQLKRLEIPLPSRSEQAAIVRFLDHADRRIRRYIRAKQKLIKLLEEQKQVLIGRAVTRGLDPDVRRKPSYIQWLGEIPGHWNVRRVKSELRNLNTRRIPLSATERGRMTLRRYDYYGASGIIDKVDDYLFDDELLLIAEDGANLVLRNLPLAIIARGRFWVNNHAHILKVKRGSLEYFAALLECIEFSPWITGAAQPKLTQDRLMGIHIPVPPEEEQFRIATWVRSNTAEIESTIHRARTEISLLGELRTRVIADVVTGKLDVREAAARLPDVFDEEPAPEALDEDEPSLDGDDAGAEALDPELQEA